MVLNGVTKFAGVIERAMHVIFAASRSVCGGEQIARFVAGQVWSCDRCIELQKNVWQAGMQGALHGSVRA